MTLLVATIGRAHGLAGELALAMHTDAPERRLGPGSTVCLEPAEPPERAAAPLEPFPTQLEVVRLRRDPKHGWFAIFREICDRTSAEAMRGARIVVEETNSDEAEAWYPHELAGLRAELADGTLAGTVTGIEHLVAQDALTISEPDGNLVLLPFVTALVPEVDIPRGRVVIDPPGGMFAVRPGA